MRTRMYGGVRGRKTKVGGKPTFVFLLLDCLCQTREIEKSIRNQIGRIRKDCYICKIFDVNHN